MKSDPARWDVFCVAAALVAGMLLVMWAQRPSSDCTLLPEASRHLVLTRETDREHLAGDIASVARIARRYSASSPSVDQTADGFAACEAILVQQIGIRHDIPQERLRGLILSDRAPRALVESRRQSPDAR